MSAVTVWAQQPKLIKAAAKAGIKRFFPSEFGHDADAGYPLPLEMILGPKVLTHSTKSTTF